MLPEGFKRIKGFDGYYAVNEEGKVITFRKRSNRGAKLVEEFTGYVKPWINHPGKNTKCSPRPQITLYNGIEKKKFYMNRLMAMTFLGFNGGNTAQVIHLDGDNFNYKLSNLKVSTAKERTLRWKNKKCF